ncbi:MAG: hypothetical protein JXB07_13225 [Anaerolineae bacterium]|nr:hypothetical protein [Anaerolineae bacterium]
MPHQAATLLATLGSEPQVITLTLDCLHAMGERIDRAVVLHTTSTLPGGQVSLDALIQEFGEYPRYQNSGLRFEPTPFLSNEIPIPDVTTPEQAHAVLHTLYHQVSVVKEDGSRLHLCPAGGRKAMSMYAMLVAQILFGEDDRLWMLVSTEPLRLERRFHARPGEASLLAVPVLPWRITLSEKQAFLRGCLTPAEAEVLALVAGSRLTDPEIAARRGTTPKTVGHQLAAIYAKLRDHLGYREDARVDRQTLVAEFSPYFAIIEALQSSPGNVVT